MSNSGRVSIKIRPMLAKHLDDVENIENSSFDHPWSRDELESTLGNQNDISKVALVTPKGSKKSIVAGMLYLEHKEPRLNVLSIAVHPEWRRRGIGTTFLEYLIKLLRRYGRCEIYELVRETNLDAQKFYKSLGFVAQRPKHNIYEETNEDAYPMIYKWEWSPQGRASNGIPNSCTIRNHLCTGCGDCC